MRTKLAMACCALMWTMTPGPARADGAHAYLQISEVVTGLYANPNVQYVVLRVLVGGPTEDYALVNVDNSGSTEIGRSFVTSDVANLSPGDTILIANSAASSFFGVQPDFPLTGQPLALNGALCLLNPFFASASPSDPNGIDDCFFYGEINLQNVVYLPQNGSATPFNATLNGTGGGVRIGNIAQRYNNHNSTTPTVSYTSAIDFWFAGTPWPQNNLGIVGAVTATCGNGTLEGTEQCDNGAQNGVGGNACSGACLLVPGVDSTCGNGTLEPGEQCDDGNLVNGDGCSSTCQWENLTLIGPPACGNGVVEGTEACDPPKVNVCTSSCQMAGGATASCGDGVVEVGEQCDLGANNGASAACSTTCHFNPSYFDANPNTRCGNFILDPGEQCDHGSAADPNGTNGKTGDSCSASCTYVAGGTAHVPVSTCGDGIVQPTEECDDGADNCDPSKTTCPAGENCKPNCTFIVTPQEPVGSATSTTGSSTGGVATTGGGIPAGGSGTTSGGTNPEDYGTTLVGTTGGSVSRTKFISCSSIEGDGVAWFGVMLAGLYGSRRRRAGARVSRAGQATVWPEADGQG